MVHSSPNRRRYRVKTQSSSMSPNWLELPRDVTVAILQKVPVIEILKNVQRVCTNWRKVCKEEPLVWKTIDMGGPIDYPIRFFRQPEICKQAVDLSRGCLIDLSMGYFATNELLHYVTDRCTKIQRLQLKKCDEITDEGLYNAAHKFPLLEDLELSYCSNITEKTLQRLGECCPRLKSLKINQQGSKIMTSRNDEAMTIAKHMPELRHLQLFGSRMTKSGLDAILEGCPHLESLDLRQCFNIYLKISSLRKICDERRIRDLRCPNDSTDDYEYDTTLSEVEYWRRCKEMGYSDELTEYLECNGYVPDESITSDVDDDDESPTPDLDDDNELPNPDLDDNDESATPNSDDDDESSTPDLDDDNELPNPDLDDNDESDELPNPDLDDNDESATPDSDDDDESNTSDGPVYLACRAKSLL